MSCANCCEHHIVVQSRIPDDCILPSDMLLSPRWVIITGSCITIVCYIYLFVMYYYYKAPQFHGHPTSFAIYKNWFEFIFSIQFLFVVTSDAQTTWYSRSYFYDDTKACPENHCCASRTSAILAFVSQVCLLGNELWFAAIAIDLHLTYSNPFSSYTETKRIIQTIIHVLCFGVGLILLFATNPWEIGPSEKLFIWIHGRDQYSDYSVITFEFFYFWLFCGIAYSLYTVYSYPLTKDTKDIAVMDSRRPIMIRARRYVTLYTLYWIMAIACQVLFLIFGANDDNRGALIGYIMAYRGPCALFIIIYSNREQMHWKVLFPFFYAKTKEEEVSMKKTTKLQQAKEKLAMQPHLNRSLRSEILFFASEGIKVATNETHIHLKQIRREYNHGKGKNSKNVEFFNQNLSDEAFLKIYLDENIEEKGREKCHYSLMDKLKFQGAARESNMKENDDTDIAENGEGVSSKQRSSSLKDRSASGNTGIGTGVGNDNGIWSTLRKCFFPAAAAAEEAEAERVGQAARASSIRTSLRSSLNDDQNDRYSTFETRQGDQVMLLVEEDLLGDLDREFDEFAAPEDLRLDIPSSSKQRASKSVSISEGKDKVGVVTSGNGGRNSSQVRSQGQSLSGGLGSKPLDEWRVRKSKMRDSALMNPTTANDYFNWGLQNAARAVSNIGSTLFVSSYSKNFQFNDNAPLLYKRIRDICEITDSEYFQAFESVTKENFSEGRSGAFVFFSHDMKFFVKTHSEEEIFALQNMLPKYITHLEENPESLLTRFVGAHSINIYGKEIFFAVMTSIFPSDVFLDGRFDLKGSWINRHRSGYTITRNGFNVSKDSPLFLDNDLQYHINISDESADDLYEQASKDSDFLTECNFMDYSLLVGVVKSEYDVEDKGEMHNVSSSESLAEKSDLVPRLTSSTNIKPIPSKSNSIVQPKTVMYRREYHTTKVEAPQRYYIGMIDVLQQWNIWKKLEVFYKTTILRLNSAGISAIEPTKYRKRFLKRVMLKCFPNITIADDDQKDLEWRDKKHMSEALEEARIHMHTGDHEIDVDLIMNPLQLRRSSIGFNSRDSTPDASKNRRLSLKLMSMDINNYDRDSDFGTIPMYGGAVGSRGLSITSGGSRQSKSSSRTSEDTVNTSTTRDSERPTETALHSNFADNVIDLNQQL